MTGLITLFCKRTPFGHQPSVLNGESSLRTFPLAATNRIEEYIFKVIAASPDATG